MYVVVERIDIAVVVTAKVPLHQLYHYVFLFVLFENSTVVVLLSFYGPYMIYTCFLYCLHIVYLYVCGCSMIVQ